MGLVCKDLTPRNLTDLATGVTTVGPNAHCKSHARTHTRAHAHKTQLPCNTDFAVHAFTIVSQLYCHQNQNNENDHNLKKDMLQILHRSVALLESCGSAYQKKRNW